MKRTFPAHLTDEKVMWKLALEELEEAVRVEPEWTEVDDYYDYHATPEEFERMVD